VDKHHLETEFENGAPLRAPLDSLGPNAAPPPSHDSLILKAARDTSAAIGNRAARRGRWPLLMSMAASFLVGVGATWLYTTERPAGQVELSGLVLPIAPVVRDAGGPSDIPVEQASADDWYRYIQELVYSGDTKLAAKHIQRFVELHPDYEPKP
jgi:hypothetical protein